jgi:FkbM family methyltransferase
MKRTELKKLFEKGRITKSKFIKRMHNAHSALYDYVDLIGSSDISKLEISGSGVVADIGREHVRMLCTQEDERVIPFEILNFGSFEARELEILAGLCKGKGTLFDIGANVGWYSLNLAKRFPALRVFSFEPVPATYKTLRANIALNGLSNIHTFNHGLSDRRGKTSFFVDPSCSGSASAARLTGSRHLTRVVCRVQKLDDFVKRRRVKVDVIKCDVEGAELLVLKGGIQTLERDQPIIFLEMLRKWSAAFGYHPNDIIKLLSNLGYECFVCRGTRLRKFGKVRESTKETNYFFVPGRQRSRLAGN